MSEALVPVAEPVDVARTGPAQRVELVLPQLIVDAGPAAVGKVLEFFAARIANRRTRAAYGRAVGQFLAWCEARAFCRGAKVLDAFHVLPLLERKHRAVAEATALVDWRLAPVWRQVRAELARHTRKPDQEWVRMLRLMETHPVAAVERAVTAALEARLSGLPEGVAVEPGRDRGALQRREGRRRAALRARPGADERLRAVRGARRGGRRGRRRGRSEGMSEALVPVAEPVDVARTGPAQRVELVLPQLIVDAGPAAVGKVLEFFAARIANRRTRAAYGRAVGQFLAWCEARGLALEAVSPLHVAAYIRTHPIAPGFVDTSLGYAAWRTRLPTAPAGRPPPRIPVALAAILGGIQRLEVAG